MFRQQELRESDKREFWALQDVLFEVKHVTKMLDGSISFVYHQQIIWLEFLLIHVGVLRHAQDVVGQTVPSRPRER
jgi:hypothetical protein